MSADQLGFIARGKWTTNCLAEMLAVRRLGVCSCCEKSWRSSCMALDQCRVDGRAPAVRSWSLPEPALFEVPRSSSTSWTKYGVKVNTLLPIRIPCMKWTYYKLWQNTWHGDITSTVIIMMRWSLIISLKIFLLKLSEFNFLGTSYISSEQSTAMNSHQQRQQRTPK